MRAAFINWNLDSNAILKTSENIKFSESVPLNNIVSF